MVEALLSKDSGKIRGLIDNRECMCQVKGLSIQANWKSPITREFGENVVLSCRLRLPPAVSCGAKGVAEK